MRYEEPRGRAALYNQTSWPAPKEKFWWLPMGIPDFWYIPEGYVRPVDPKTPPWPPGSYTELTPEVRRELEVAWANRPPTMTRDEVILDLDKLAHDCERAGRLVGRRSPCFADDTTTMRTADMLRTAIMYLRGIAP